MAYYNVRITALYELIKQAELKLKLQNCFFFKRGVVLPMHGVNRNGTKAEIGNLEQAAHARVSRSKKELRLFAILCSFYQRFGKRFAKEAASLHALTAKHQPV